MSISILEAKKKADRLHARMNELGFRATHAQALEVLACAFGDESWAAMRARLNVHAATCGKNNPEEGLRIYTMVVNPVFLANAQYRHDLRVHVLASSLAEAQQRVTEYGAAHGVMLKGVVAMEDQSPVNRQTMPDLACFSLDLAAQMENSDALRDAFEEFIHDNVRSLAAKKTDAYSRDEIAELLKKAAQEFSGPDSFFQVLTAVLNRSGAYRGYVSLGNFGFFSKSQIQGIRWATA